MLGVGSRIRITLENFHRKHMKVLCLVTERIRTPIESSNSFTIKWLKPWMCGSMKLTARKESTCGSQRDHLPNVLDEVSPNESIKLMGTGEIIPSDAQAEEEIIISAPNQPEDTTQPEVNADDENND